MTIPRLPSPLTSSRFQTKAEGDSVTAPLWRPHGNAGRAPSAGLRAPKAFARDREAPWVSASSERVSERASLLCGHATAREPRCRAARAPDARAVEAPRARDENANLGGLMRRLLSRGGWEATGRAGPERSPSPSGSPPAGPPEFPTWPCTPLCAHRGLGEGWARTCASPCPKQGAALSRAATRGAEASCVRVQRCGRGVRLQDYPVSSAPRCSLG